MATASIQERFNKSENAMRYRVAYRRDGSRKLETTPWMVNLDDAVKIQEAIKKRGVDLALRLFRIETNTKGAPTLTEWLPKHLARRSTKMTPGTAAEYERMAARTFLITLGDIPVDQITDQDVIDWIAWQSKQPTVSWEKKAETARKNGKPVPEMETYSSKSVRNAHGFLSSMLSTLVDADHITKNVARGLRLPQDELKENREIFARDEWEAFYAAMQDEYKPFIAFMLLSGCRINEATALRVRDFDFATRSVRIARAWKKAEKGVVLGSPKTRRSLRTILLGNEIEKFRGVLDGKAPDDLAFTAPRGGMIHAHRFRERQWAAALDRSGMSKDLTPHCLRHTFASWALMAGVAPQVVQMRLGHESLETTSKVYAHLILDEQQQAVDAIGWNVPLTLEG